jgi:hypothetical protein
MKFNRLAFAFATVCVCAAAAGCFYSHKEEVREVPVPAVAVPVAPAVSSSSTTTTTTDDGVVKKLLGTNELSEEAVQSQVDTGGVKLNISQQWFDKKFACS